MTSETENQIRLRRAKESVIACQAVEMEARRALASAVESTKLAREKYEELFMAEEKQERARSMRDYNHCTK
jgi:hypothetical protein